MNTLMSILSSVADEAGADKLPAVGLPGGLCSTTFSHRPISVFIDKFYAFQNGPPNGSQQTCTWTTLCNSLMPLKDAVSCANIHDNPRRSLERGYIGQ